MTKHNSNNDSSAASQRLDKWLWAARFFKTRALAVEAVSGGRVHLDGKRVKPSRAVRPGMELLIHKGEVAMTVEIVGLNAHRRPASEAVLLYQESAASIAAREQHAALRRSAGQRDAGSGRPTKRDRRHIHRFRRNSGDGDRDT